MIRIFAGFMVFVSALLAFFFSRNWLFLTMFVGLNLFQYGFTDFCPLGYLLEKLGLER